LTPNNRRDINIIIEFPQKMPTKGITPLPYTGNVDKYLSSEYTSLFYFLICVLTLVLYVEIMKGYNYKKLKTQVLAIEKEKVCSIYANFFKLRKKKK